MKKKYLRHEAFAPLQQAIRVHEEVIALARTDLQLINQRLMVRALSLLDHTGCAGTEHTAPARARRVHSARLALTKLATTIDAAKRMALISADQADRVREQLITLEEMLSEPPVAPVAATSRRDNPETEPELPAASGELSPDDLQDLRQLIERDKKPATVPDEGEDNDLVAIGYPAEASTGDSLAAAHDGG